MWELITLKQYPLFSRHWVHEALKKDMKVALGMGFTSFKSLYNGSYVDQDQFSKIKRHMIHIFKTDKKEIWRRVGEWKHWCDELLKFTKNLVDDYSNHTDLQLLSVLEDIIRLVKKNTAFIFLAASLDQHLQDWLSKALKKKNAMRYLNILASSNKKTKLYDARIELARLKESNDPDIATFLRQYNWLGFDTLIGSYLTHDDVCEQIKNVKPIKVEISRQEVIRNLKLTNTEKDNLALMSELIYLRTYRAESNMIAGARIRPLFEEIAKRLGAEYDEVVNLTFEEMIDALASKTIDRDEMKRRKQKYGYITVDNKDILVSGDDVDEYEEKANIKADQLEGMIANPGYARGRARIVTGIRDFKKVKKGDILIAKNTNPNFMTVIQKSAGFVTDVGGITCHAAVVSRELDKPCVIGTKHATQVFKDGDMVEVDANKGIVKKIEKSAIIHS